MSSAGKAPRGASVAEIAARTGVPVGTVARVLSASGSNDAERRRAVREAGELLSAESTASEGAPGICAAKTIGVLTELSESSYCSTLTAGIADALAAHGYTALRISGEWSARQEAEQVLQLAARRADGVILLGSMMDDAQLLRLSAHLPIVLTGRMLCGERVRSRCVDNLGGARLAVNHLLSLGHRRIAHIAGPPDQWDARERLAGYRVALEEAGLRFDPNLVVQGGFLKGGGLAAMHALLERAAAFTAVFAGNDLSAWGARIALQRYGIRVPDDISLVGFDDAVDVVAKEPRLTTIRQPVYELGRAAAVDMIELVGETAREGVAVRPLELVIRDSTRRLR
ncbi:LacI family DNA-binding transcriptional regulator [Niveibacterium umoris]|uniref:LacI family transcriptional regulator n=1 Tax=Niveibacterium umoris TaxID=1193620 RepID=A0A840BKA0_9RHOO|nr:substrate-binding domain-containing protein [Niveibacterium umoris]MBB4012844.1 LacI family transcriptional regulator [Niveibacterium umoris]